MTSEKLLVEAVVSEMFGQNAFIVRLEGRKDGVIVDPGFESDKIIERVQELGLTPAAILNTHGHADHIAGNAAIKERWPDCPLVIGSEDAYKLTDADANLSQGFGFGLISPPADVLVQDGQQYTAAGIVWEVLGTPGHSCGHVVYLWKGGTPWVVLVGDVLFRGSVGRSDFADSDPRQLTDSIRGKLYALPEDTEVFPGHGEATTIGDEKRFNPFVPA